MKKQRGMARVLLLLGSLLLKGYASDNTGLDEISVVERMEAINLDTFQEQELEFVLDTITQTESLIYPEEVDAYLSLIHYDEIPTPIPFGPSVWFIIITTLALVWYMTAAVEFLIRRYTPNYELYPKTEAFPRLYVHWLQQSKRECNLRREARNTWCYTAKTLLMSPEDPLMDIDEACSTSWADMQHHRNIWQIVRVVVIANGMLRQIRERNRYLKLTNVAPGIQKTNEKEPEIAAETKSGGEGGDRNEDPEENKSEGSSRVKAAKSRSSSKSTIIK